MLDIYENGVGMGMVISSKNKIHEVEIMNYQENESCILLIFPKESLLTVSCDSVVRVSG